ncbi:MAG: CdaR family protein [Armatimonadota bacterium]|nr:CdaR family protein [Armatimonadota bacterium]
MRENLGYKLLALLMAILLWAKVNGDRNPNITKKIDNVQAVYASLPKGYLLTDAPKRIQVNVTGPQSVLRSLDASQIKVRVDLSGAEVGTHSIKPKIKPPHSLVDKVRLSAKDIEVRIETFKRRSLDIAVSFQGVAPLGYTFGQAVANPPAAVISGRSSLVDRVRRLNVLVSPGVTQPSDEDYYPVTALDAAGNQIKELTIEPSRVSAKWELKEAQATKSVIVSPTIIGQPVYPLRVSSVTVSPPVVTIYGRPNNLVNVSTISTETIDISNAVETITRTVSLRTPSGIKSTDAQTVKVTVKIVQ